MNVNSTQVGGDHYKAGFQHWDLVVKWHVPYLEAQVMKYVTRCHKKNKRQDLEKALHFADKLVDVTTRSNRRFEINFQSWFYPSSLARVHHIRDTYGDLAEYAAANGLDTEQEMICWLCLTGCDAERLRRAVSAYLEAQYPAEPQPHGYVNQDRDMLAFAQAVAHKD